MPARLEGRFALMEQLREQARQQTRKVIEKLDYVGMKTVAAIRDSEVSNWKDDTGNLRSSIGYLVLCDGTIESKNFALVNNRGRDGLESAKSYAQELAAQFPKGYVLIIVAGMNYAAYVEAVESKTVLAGGERFARNLLEKVLKENDFLK